MRSARILPALALVLAGTGLLGRPALEAGPAAPSQAQAHLLLAREGLGLGPRDGFRARQAFTNAQGQAVVRLDQTYDGHRVWGGQAVTRVQAGGGASLLAHSLQAGIALAGEPRVDAEQARRIALAHLAPKGPMTDAPQVERVVFPAQFLGGLPATLDPATGKPALDRKRLVHARLDTPYVWAYEVRTRLHNPADGHREFAYLISGDTGAILRVDDRVQHLEPVRGTGKGFYQGEVTLDATRMDDGTYALLDTTRGSLPNPGLAGFEPDAPTGWSPALAGMQVWFGQNEATGVPTGMDYLFQSPQNAWGDGLAFTAWGQEGASNGQTAGVDALSAMATTWDFYRNVFGRDGLDGQGTSVVATVLRTRDADIDNASWSTWSKGMNLGAGSYPANPKGFRSMTDLDVIAHEMTHGVTSPSQAQALFSGAGAEEAGLNEAVSDFFSQMVVAYASRPAGSDAVIPATGAPWTIGSGVGRGTPLRSMIKPSLDQRSVDGWYDGIAYMDGHYSAGPLNRAFYFLAHGASSTPGAPDFSPYLPQGMAGIGNDAAARVIYKAVTEYLAGDGTGSITFEDVRKAALASATMLQAGFSPWVIAVRDAFAAANIGDAHGQMSPRTQVLFSDFRRSDYIDSTHHGRYYNRQIFPKGETVTPRVTVLNNSNTAVTWSLGGPSLFNGADANIQKGGTLNLDGTWTTPNVMGWHAITATSVADPTQFAEGRPFLIDMDTDMDQEQDALDMGGIAFSWYLTTSLNPAHSVFEAPWVDDGDVSFFVDAMRAAWPVK